MECLENEEAEYVFGLPGEETIDILDSMNGARIKFVPVRHEQGAAFMADVYGRLTQRAGVCLATLGPGATNLITGVADANMDRAPLVAITGQAGLAKTHKESHQYIDIVSALRPITKWNARIASPDSVAEIVRKAFRVAQTEKFGATHIELPEDIAGLQSDARPLRVTSSPRFHPDILELDKAVELIQQAEKPLILAGNGVIRGRASRELVEFAVKNNVFVANTFMAKGVIPAKHELCLATIGLQQKDYVSCGFDQADLVIAVGYDFVEYGSSLWNPANNKKIIHVDSVPAEVDANYVPAVELVGDLRTTLKILSTRTGFRKGFDYPNTLRTLIKEEYAANKLDVSFPLKPQKVLYDIRKAMGDCDILISDVGAHKLWIARNYPAREPNTVIISNGFASMGIAVPGAVAAKLAEPKRQVLAVTGDGGFLMNSQEIETAKRLGVHFTIVVFNDAKYGVIGWKQKKKFGRESGVSFTNPDFVAYAESFGAKGYRVESAADLYPTLEKALSTKNVCIVDVPITYGENMIFSDKFDKNVCPI